MTLAFRPYYYFSLILFLGLSDSNSQITVEARRSRLPSQFHRIPPHSFLIQQQQQQEEVRQHSFQPKWGLQKFSHIRGGASAGGNLKDIMEEEDEKTKADDDSLHSDKICQSTFTKISSHDSYTTIGILHIPSSLNKDKSETYPSSNSFDLIETSASCIAIVKNHNEDEDDQDGKKYDISLGTFSASAVNNDPSKELPQQKDNSKEDSRISLLNNMTAETIGISSEILFIFMPSTVLTTTSSSTTSESYTRQQQQQQFFQSLQHGIERRCKAGWSKPKVVIIMLDVGAEAPPTTRQELQQKFVLSSDILGTTTTNHHEFWSPHYMESLDILFDEEELYQVWKDLLVEWQNEEGQKGAMITQELFPKFVKQVTHSLLLRNEKNDNETSLSMQWSNNIITVKNDNAKEVQNNNNNKHTVTTDVTQENDQDKQVDLEVVGHEVSIDNDEQDELKVVHEVSVDKGDGGVDIIIPETVKNELPLEQDPTTASTTPRVRRHDDIITTTNTKHEHDHNTNDVDKQYWMDIAQSVMSTARDKMALLETKQEDVWLHYLEDDDNNEDEQGKKNAILGRRVPLLEFGQDATAVLVEASESLKDAPSLIRTQVLMDIASGELRHLYHQQLQSLREHYGRMYEKVLDQVGIESEEEDDESRQRIERMKTEAASQASEGFRVAAQHAIPTLCQQGQELEDADYSYVSILQGLLSDMMEATTLRQDDQALLDDHDHDEDGGEGGGTHTSKRPRRYTWYEKLAARVVVLGVNYLQGWLAWQGIRKAAAERDRQMPKFPLF